MRITDQYKPVQTTVSNVYVAEATSICLQCRNPDGVLAAPVGQDHLPSMPLDRAAAEEMRGNSLKVSQGRFRLDIRDFFSMERAVQSSFRLPREVVESPFLAEFESHVDITFGDKG